MWFDLMGVFDGCLPGDIAIVTDWNMLTKYRYVFYFADI